MKKTLVNVLLACFLTMICAAQNKTAPKPADKSVVINGVVSDDQCGTKIDPDCTSACLEKGAKLVVVNNSDNSVIPVSNWDSLKSFIGRHVTVKGTMDHGTLTIASVKPVD